MEKNFRLPAEWEPQSAVLIAWPHEHTDWNYMLDEVTECYKNIARAILEDEHLIVASPIDPIKICDSTIPNSDQRHLGTRLWTYHQD